MPRPQTDPTSERPCIWVAAGILSYRLCDRDFDCEHCELHRALGGQSEVPAAGLRGSSGNGGTLSQDRDPIEEQVAEYMRHLLSGCTLHLDRYHSAGHFWLEPCEDGDVLAGLDPHVWRAVHPADHITTPQTGVWMKRGDPCGWVTRGRLSVSLTAPISGEVADVNPAYTGEGARLPDPCLREDGWLLRIRPHEAITAIPDLLQGDGALRWHLRTILLIKHHLRGALPAGPTRELGQTLADGGATQLDLAQVLGRERFEALVLDLFQMHI